MSQAAAIDLSALIPELLPTIGVEAAAASSFARVLAALEQAPVEVETDIVAAQAPQFEFRSPPPVAVGTGPTRLLVAEPTVPAPEIRPPALPPPDPIPAPAPPPTRDAGAPAPLPAVSLPPELLRAATRQPVAKPAVGIDLETKRAETQSQALNDEPCDHRPSPAGPIETSPLNDKAGVGTRVVATLPVPPVIPSADALTYARPAVSESPIHAGESSPATASTRPLESAPLMAGPELGSQLEKRIGLMLQSDMHRAEIRVFPRDLGSVKINLNVQSDGVEIEMEASSALMVEELQHAAPRLRALLSEQGLGLTHLAIDQQKPGSQRRGAEGSRSGPEIDAARGNDAEEDDSPAAADTGAIRLSISRLIDVFA